MRKTWAVLVALSAVGAVAAGCSSSPKPANSDSLPGLHEIGTGTSTTRPFAITHNAWTIDWSFHCPTKGVFTFHVEGSGPSAGVTENGVSEIEKSGSGAVHYSTKGTFIVPIAAGPTCQWSLLVTQK
jgi:hypothetical protein